LKFISTILVFFAISAHAQSFTAGNHFISQVIYGDLDVQCHDPGHGMRTAFFQCQEQTLDPAEYSYFTGPKVQADQVHLKAVWQNGHQTGTKDVGYADGKSVDAINLWISTLFQRPLLDEGLNKVSYELSNSGKTVASGEFDVMVDEAGTLHCPRGFIDSFVSADCDNQYSVCDRYFRDHNYCK